MSARVTRRMRNSVTSLAQSFHEQYPIGGRSPAPLSRPSHAGTHSDSIASAPPPTDAVGRVALLSGFFYSRATISVIRVNFFFPEELKVQYGCTIKKAGLQSF
eukprot:scaffold135457_cov30-Tisochrysis_lutea.AAC.3